MRLQIERLKLNCFNLQNFLFCSICAKFSTSKTSFNCYHASLYWELMKSHHYIYLWEWTNYAI